MALYLVSYDIRTKNYDYGPLLSRLRQYGAVHVLESVWILPYGGLSASEAIGIDLKGHILEGDSLLVQEAGMDASWYKLLIPDGKMDTLVLKARF